MFCSVLILKRKLQLAEPGTIHTVQDLQTFTLNFFISLHSVPSSPTCTIHLKAWYKNANKNRWFCPIHSVLSFSSHWDPLLS